MIEPAGVGMIVGEPLEVMVQRVRRPRRKHAGLPHAAAEAVIRACRRLTVGPRSGAGEGRITHLDVSAQQIDEAVVALRVAL